MAYLKDCIIFAVENKLCNVLMFKKKVISGMKNVILLFTALMMVGCVYKTKAEREEAKRLSGFNIIIIDSCEYLKMSECGGYFGYGYFAHKGNCRFCKERKQKGLKESETK